VLQHGLLHTNQQEANKSTEHKIVGGLSPSYATLPRMTKFTISSGTKTAFRIPAKPAQPEKQDIERIGVSAEVASEMLGVGTRTMWNLAKEQKVRTVRIGTRVVFSVQSLREFIDGKPEPADKPDVACVAEGKESK